MSVNLDTEILNFEGKSFDDKPVILRDILIQSLLAESKDVKTPKEKGEDFVLACELRDSMDYKFTSEQVTKLKTKVGTFYATIIYGRVVEILEK